MAESRLKTLSTSADSQTLAGSYRWEIDNFLSQLDTLRSQTVSIGPKNDIILHLYLFQTTIDEQPHCLVKCCIEQINTDLPVVSLKHGFSLIDSGETKIFEETRHQRELELFTGITLNVGFFSKAWFDLRSDGFLQEGTLTLLYEVNLCMSIQKFDIPLLTMSRDWRALLESQEGSDVKLLVDSQEFPAHKAILCARSPVFSAMFETELKEGEGDTVKIDDIDPETFKELLRFVYTNDVENLKQNAYELLKAAQKFNFSRLKSMCEVQLCENLDTENCAKIFVAADTYQCKELKQQALQFIVENVSAVVKTSGCNSVEKSHPQLMLEVLGALVEKMNNNN